MGQEVEVAIIGAGAAGIAAARRLRMRGRSVLLIEATNRAGGRAWTVEAAGLSLDLGCGWLHSAERNPLAGVAEAAEVTIDRSEAAWGRQLRNLGYSQAEQRAAQVAFGGMMTRLADDPPPSDRVGDAITRDDPWRGMIDMLSGAINGAELDRISARDFIAYDEAASEVNWRVPTGYGRLIAGLVEGLPILLDAPVRAIDHGGHCIAIDTARGRIEAGAAIVAVPTTVLARGAIRFTPPLDDHLHAAASLPLGCVEKLFLHIADVDAVPAEAHLIGNPHTAETGSYYIRPFGWPVIECFFGGIMARRLAAGPADGWAAFAIEELAALLGSDFARGLTPVARSSWGGEVWIGGAYSHAVPGAADQRAALARPASDRLFFAGEACSAHDFSTAHGAWETGIAAADRVEEMLGSRHPT